MIFYENTDTYLILQSILSKKNQIKNQKTNKQTNKPTKCVHVKKRNKCASNKHFNAFFKF